MSRTTVEGGFVIEHVTPAFLTHVLQADDVLGGARRVEKARQRRVAMDTGLASALHRVEYETDDGGMGSVFVKLPSSDPDARQAMDAIGGYDRELVFYEHIAHRAPLRAPRAHHVGRGRDTADFMLVLEDLQGWENGNHFDGLSMSRARGTLSALAGLHAWSSDPSRAPGVQDLVASLDNARYRTSMPALFASGWPVYLEHARRRPSNRIDEFARSFRDHFPALLDGLTERDELIHGDIRADNVLFRDDQVAIIDFQMMARATGLTDVAYLVSQGMTTAERGGRDRELLEAYLQAYASAGGASYPLVDAWRHYRLGVLMGFAFPISPLYRWDTLSSAIQELCLRLVARSIATIEDIDALGAIA